MVYPLFTFMASTSATKDTLMKNVQLKINLEVGKTKITLWSNDFSKSIGKPDINVFN